MAVSDRFEGGAAWLLWWSDANRRTYLMSRVRRQHLNNLRSSVDTSARVCNYLGCSEPAYNFRI